MGFVGMKTYNPLFRNMNEMKFHSMEEATNSTIKLHFIPQQ